jgi:amidophosphoribosyltransferase
VIRGKRVVVVDDSIVRGNTQRAIVRMLREAGAASVHIKISSPPVKWPCFYGIDFASRAELIANGATIDEISQAIGADSLAYISEDGMIGATRQPRERLCTACFTGKYPIELPGADKLGKNLLERTDLGGLPAAGDAALGATGAPAAATPGGTAATAVEPVEVTPGNPATIPVTEDPAERPGATGCDPGPDAEFEELLTDSDRVNP